jgi:ABC-type Fe3+ transport system permease subunit
MSMEEHDHNGQKRQQPDREAATTANLGLASIIVICLGVPVLIAGFAAALNNSYKVGPYAGFAGGLTSIVVASVMISGGSALICHRLNLMANARTRAEVRALHRDVRTLIMMMAERSESADDQVGAARRGHEN